MAFWYKKNLAIAIDLKNEQTPESKKGEEKHENGFSI